MRSRIEARANPASYLTLAVVALLAGCRDVQKDPQYCETCGTDAAVARPPQAQTTEGAGSSSEVTNGSTPVGGGGFPGSANMTPAAMSGGAGKAGSPAAGSGAGAPSIMSMNMDAGLDSGTPKPNMDGGKDAGDSSTALPDSSTKPDAGQPDTAPPSPCGGPCPDDAPVCDAARRLCVQCTQDDKHACNGDNPVCDVIKSSCVPCNATEQGACRGNKSVCELDSLTCVECSALRLDTCTGDKRVCDTQNHVCAECTAVQPGSCDASGKHCLIDAQRCVECLEPAHCASPQRSSCDPNHTCQPCTDDQACAHIAGLLACDLNAHACVECTKAQHCPPGSSCNEQHKCQVNPQPTRMLCETCTQSSECPSTAGCAAYPGLGPRFCFPKAQDRNCNMPSFSHMMRLPTDGGDADFCLPPASCKAISDTIARTRCTRANVPDESCGERALREGVCNPNSTCSYACAVPQDCPTGFNCLNGSCQ